MARGRYETVLRNVRTLFEVGTVGGLTDGELLDRFEAGPGEVAELAFAVLVERHGPMVLRACRRILHDEHAAQDAFQATFLVLVRKGATARRRDTLGPWLHGVACRVAACSRSAAARRHRHEQNAATRPDRPAPESPRDDSGGAIHEEIDRLPERYRWPIVLRCLEGQTREQAALRLGWRVGTVQSRLARGRERLRERLIRRGLAPAVGTVAAALAVEAEAAMTAVPGGLVEATIRCGMGFAAWHTAAGAVPAGVASLISGVFQAMLIQKLKAAAGTAAAVAPWSPSGSPGDSHPRPTRAAGGKARRERRLRSRWEIAVEEAWKREASDRLIDALEGSGQIGLSTDPEVLNGELKIASQTLDDAKQKASWAETMAVKGYVSTAQMRAERLALMRAEQAVARAKARIKASQSSDAAPKGVVAPTGPPTSDVAPEAPIAPPAPPQPPAEPRPPAEVRPAVPPRGAIDIRTIRNLGSDRIDVLEKRLEAIEHRLDALEHRDRDGGNNRGGSLLQRRPLESRPLPDENTLLRLASRLLAPSEPGRGPRTRAASMSEGHGRMKILSSTASIRGRAESGRHSSDREWRVVSQFGVGISGLSGPGRGRRPDRSHPPEVEGVSHFGSGFLGEPPAPPETGAPTEANLA